MLESRGGANHEVSVKSVFKEQIREVISQLPGLVSIFPRNLGKVLSLSLPRISLVVHFGVQLGLQAFLTITFAGRGDLGVFLVCVPVPEYLSACSCPSVFEGLFLQAVLMENRGWKVCDLFVTSGRCLGYI